eukprot:3755165-Amphidinium_carterae.1
MSRKARSAPISTGRDTSPKTTCSRNRQVQERKSGYRCELYTAVKLHNCHELAKPSAVQHIDISFDKGLS